MIEVSIVVGDYPHTSPLKEEQIKDPRLKFNFIEYKPVRTAFAPMSRDLAFDVCELAIGTFFQAIDIGKPLLLLPVVTVGSFHHGSLWYDPTQGSLAPGDLKGRRVGVRAYTQTTGLWVRGILQEQYHISSDSVTWVTTENSHVEGFVNPPNVEVIHSSATLAEMLHSGEISAAIMGTEHGDPTLKRLISDPDDAIMEWYEKHRCVPVNHMIAINKEWSQQNPGAVRVLYDMFCKAYEMALPKKDTAYQMVCTGKENIWEALELAMEYARRQKLISRTFSEKEVFADLTY